MAKTKNILFKLLVIISIISIWVWYSHPIFELTFKDDDAHIMRVALTYPWYAFLTEPFAYQELSTAHYTPWVLWSYQFDLFLAKGVNPQVFFIHQWIAVTLLICLLSILAWRISAQVTAAVIAVLLLIVNPSLFNLLTENYTRHYVEGAISISLSILAALAWLDTQKWNWWFVSVVCYAVSLLCKEIYLIIPILYFWLPQFRQSYSLFLAWAAVGIAYLWLRSLMLGTVGGGMHGTDPFLLLSIVQSGVPQVLEWLMQNHLPLIIAAGLAVIVTAQRLKILIFLAFSLIYLLIPAVFAPHVWRETAYHADRIFIVLYLFLGLFVAIRFANPIRFYRLGKYVGLISLLVWGYRTGLDNQTSVKMQTQSANHLIANELLKNPPTYDAVVAAPDFKLGELHWVIRHFQGYSIDLLLTEEDILNQYLAGKKIGRFDTTCGCIKLITEAPKRCQRSLPDERFKSAFAYRQDASISWSLTYSKIAGEAGIIFLDRHLVIPVPSLSVRLARPRQGETYRFYFIGSQGECWLGAIKTIDLGDRK